MLELQHIKKTYHVGTVETKALDDVSVAFREKEFVAILGPSGSAKLLASILSADWIGMTAAI